MNPDLPRAAGRYLRGVTIHEDGWTVHSEAWGLDRLAWEDDDDGLPDESLETLEDRSD